jgi:hypothetical protein
VLIQPKTEHAQPFLATCALGFRDRSAPTGLWSTPDARVICAVAGGYAYLIDTLAPDRFTMIPFRPVMQIVPATAGGVLLFVGHREILAWGHEGRAWVSEKISDEGVTVESVDETFIYGTGWNMLKDCEIRFALNIHDGLRRGDC